MQMAEAKTLDYYLANPDEMPDDLSEVVMDDSAQETPIEDVKAGESSDAEKDSSPSAGEVKAADVPEEAPKLLTKDGKNEIPYQVLVSERERRAAAERTAEELKQRLADIESKVATPGDLSKEVVIEDENLAAIVENYPDIGAVIKSLKSQVEQAEAKVRDVEQREQDRRVTEAQKARTAVQEAIDSTPTLSYWQTNDSEMFAKAIEFDNIIRADARNAHLTMGQRFEKVVKAMEATYGPTDLPDEYKPKVEAKQDISELTEIANKVVKETGQFKPRSLSDIPGGSPPAASETEKLTSMSANQLAAMMQGMDQDGINAMLAKLG
jgi:hypothetical protein